MPKDWVLQSLCTTILPLNYKPVPLTGLGGLGVMIEEGRAGLHPHDVGESEKVASRTRLALLAMDSLMKL